MDDLIWGVLSNRALKNGKPAQHYTYFQPAQRRAEAETIYDLDLAVGAMPCLQEHCNFLPHLMRRVRETEPYLLDMASAAEIALHRSDAAHNAYYRPEWTAFREPDLFLRETRGALQGLLGAHLAVEVILDDRLEGGTLDPFRAVVLPNSVHLPPGAGRNLRAYLDAGGAVIASMETGLRDMCGVRNSRELLWPGSGLEFGADIETCRPMDIIRSNDGSFVGVEDEIPAVPDQFLVFSDQRSIASWLGEKLALGKRADGLEAREMQQLQAGPSVHLPAPAVEVKPDKDWTVKARLRFRRSKEQGWEECPAIMTRRWGKGHITYLNFQFGTLAGRAPSGHTAWWRHLTGRLVAETAGPAPVQVEAPYCVRYFIWRQEKQNRYVLHLVNELSSEGNMGETQRENRVPVPVRVKISLPGVKDVQAVVGGRDCRIGRTGGGWLVEHPAVRERLILTCAGPRP